MSFRSYLAITSKSEIEFIEKMSIDNLKSYYKIKELNEIFSKFKIIFEFGSCSNFDTDILKMTDYVFKNKETKKILGEEYYFKKLNERNFRKIIDLVRYEIGRYYKGLLEDETKLHKYINFKREKWNDKKLVPYDMNKKNDNIIDDDTLEYNIFELVKLYKEIDFKNQVILFLGY